MLSPFRIVLLFVIAAISGILVLPGLKVDLLPPEKSTELQVSFALPNSSPDVVEQQVTSLLEGTFSQLTQLKKVTSLSGYNGGTITLYFDKSVDLQFKQFEMAALIRRVYEQLPTATTYPLILKDENEYSNNAPFLVYTINAPQQAFQIKKETEAVFKKALAMSQGISNVLVSGTENLQVTIQYDNNKCQALGINTAQISSSLQAYSNTSYPGSLTTEKGEQFFLRIQPSVQNISNIENLLIVNNTGQIICLKDVANVFIEEQEPQNYFRINGKNSVNLSITAREGENKIVLAKQIKSIINNTILQLPKGYEVKLAYDDTEFLEREMKKNYQRTALSSIILLAFILLSYRSWKYLLVLFSGLIVNLALTAILAYIFGVNIHLYTIAGLAVSFGIMIDNAIVMMDYYHQYQNRKVFLALLAATLTTIAALCLVFFLPEEDRDNLGDFALIIVMALAASLLVALWFTPGLYNLLFIGGSQKQTALNQSIPNRCKRLKRRKKWQKFYYKLINLIGQYRKVFIIMVICLFGFPVFMLPTEWEGDQWYNKWYNATIGSENYQENIRPQVEKWLGGTLRMFANDVYENSGYRNPAKTKLFVNSELPYGNTVDQMNFILSNFEKYLSTVEGIDTYITNIYSGQNGSIEINFKKGYDNSVLPYQLKSRLISKSLDWGGVEWSIYGVGQGFSNASSEEIPSFRVTIKGYNYDELEKQANKLAQKLLRHKRIQKVNINERADYGEKQSKQYILQMDKTNMTLAGANQSEVVNAITQLSKPISAQQSIVLNDQYYPVMLKNNAAEKYSSYSLMNQPLVLDSSREVRLKDFGQLVLQITANSIRKEDRQYIRIVGFEYMGSWQFGNKYLEEVLKEMKQEMPVGYTASKNLWSWDWEKTKRQYSLILLLILANFFICSILFENLKEPFYIISMIPVSFIGLFLIFSLGDFYFDQGGYAAFVMLGGLVVNAAIFIVNDFNNLRKHRPNANYNKLLIKATANRSRTIFLTTISTCCGLIPFLIEGQKEVFWFSLAIGTIGGLLFSLFAVFVVLPVFLWKRRT
jgi:multidrug efflux pump subunit AcrB